MIIEKVTNNIDLTGLPKNITDDNRNEVAGAMNDSKKVINTHTNIPIVQNIITAGKE